MKVRVDRAQFADAVAWAGRTVPARPVAPLLSCLRIEAVDQPTPHLSIASYDYEVSGVVEVPAEVMTPGVALVSGRLLADIAKALPNHPVEIVSEGSRLDLSSGRASFGLPSLPEADFPPLPELPVVSGSVPGPVLAAAASQVAVAAWRDAARGPANLTGVRVEADGDRLTFAATDRYRLAVRTINWQPRDPEFSGSALVPAKTLLDTAKSLASADLVELSLGVPGSHVGLLGISGMQRQTTTRLIDSPFPNFRSLLPSSSPIVVTFETAALLEAVRRVGLVAERSSAIRMTFTGSEMMLQAGAGDDATGMDAIDCEVTGGPMEPIAFNPGYLSEGLSAIGRPVTRMALTVPNKPAVLTGAASLEANAEDDYLYLLMPIKLPA